MIMVKTYFFTTKFLHYFWFTILLLGVIIRYKLSTIIWYKFIVFSAKLGPRRIFKNIFCVFEGMVFFLIDTIRYNLGTIIGPNSESFLQKLQDIVETYFFHRRLFASFLEYNYFYLVVQLGTYNVGKIM